MTIAVITFAVVLAVLAVDRLPPAKVALAGAMVVLLTGSIEQHDAIEAIDWGTIGLLAGMMVMVKITETTGVYTWLAIRAGQISRGRPPLVVLTLTGTTALLSAFLDNLTTILLVVPITFLLADALDIDPIPLIILEVIASNIGGTATLIGDPPNILIAGHTGLSFGAFITNLAPVVLVVFAIVTAVLYRFYRSSLQVADEARDRVMQLDARKSIEDPAELRRTMPVLLGTIVVFFFHGPLGLEPATVALSGATIMLFVTSQPVEQALSRIEWPTLFFFVGLFVVVGTLEHTGAIDEVARAVADVTGGDRGAEILGIAWTSALGSGIVDNIPFTAAMIPVVEQLQAGGDDPAYWWALALGACFGGNMTMVAAAANVAAAGMAERAGQPIGFVRFLRAGIPATVISMALATGYLALRYL